MLKAFEYLPMVSVLTCVVSVVSVRKETHSTPNCRPSTIVGLHATTTWTSGRETITSYVMAAILQLFSEETIFDVSVLSKTKVAS